MSDQPDMWFIIICRECWPEASLANIVGEQPFRSAAERGRWATDHKNGTGHDSWLVLDV